MVFWKRAHADPDAAWKQQNREQQDNPFYRYVNLDKGGKLVDMYVEYGPEATEHLIATEIEPFLYNNGKGHVVSKIDYLRWRNKADAKMAGTSLVDTRPDEQVLAEFQDDDFIRYEDHFACWDINWRGGVGETALHLCILHDTPMHTDIAKILLKLYPKLALDIYEGIEYYGESALHLAIVYGDFEMVRLLIENGANVNQRATGRFFMPEDQKKGKTKYTNYEGYAYYGEYPLAFAACFGQEEIYDYLIDHGADPNLPDSFGNTVLHMLVISNQIGMYGYAVKHHSKRAIMDLENYQQLTPLTLASKLGRNQIFKEIIELQSIEIWRYSNITCSTYPLAPLDTIGPGGRTNWSSALIYITEGETDEHLEMLDGGVIKQLIDEKWKTYARRQFIMRLILAIAHLAFVSIAIYTRPDSADDLLGPTDTTSIVRYISELIVSIASGTILVTQLGEIRAQGIIGFLKNQASAPAKFIFNISCLLILICVPLRFTRQSEAEIVFLAIAAPCAWAFLLFFARGASLFGPFVVMIYKMLATDVMRFLIIYAIFLVQFTQAFYFLFRDANGVENTNFKDIGSTIMQIIQMTLGEFRYDDFEKTRMPDLTKFVFTIFAMLVPILLLNMLIAMMGNTYQLIISRSEKEWKRQWAKIIIVLERTFSRSDLLKFQEEYAVKLCIPGSDKQEPGLMVIKTSLKTKARQRKGAISNWKKVVSEVKSLIKEVKKEGRDPSHIDLTSNDVAQKLQKRRSNQGAVTKIDEPSADNLLSAMNQLAWEKDLVLEPTSNLIPLAEEMPLEGKVPESNMMGGFLSKKDSRNNSADGARHNNNSNNKNIKSNGINDVKTTVPNSKTTPKKDATKSNNQNGTTKLTSQKPHNPKVEAVQMKDFHEGVFGSPNVFKRGSRVSPENMEAKPPSGGKKRGTNKKGSLQSGDSRPPSARSSSGGSKESKDSAFSDDRKRTNIAITGSRSSLNSASSLTSLLHAWETKDKGQKSPDNDDHTDF